MVTPFYGDLRLGKVIPEFYFEQEFWYRQAGQSHQLSPGKNTGEFDEVSANGKLANQFYFEQEFWYRQAGQNHQLSPGKKHWGIR